MTTVEINEYATVQITCSVQKVDISRIKTTDKESHCKTESIFNFESAL
jgi:hypothetical protein